MIHNFEKFKPEFLEKWNLQLHESNKINEKRIARLISDMKFILRLPKSEMAAVEEISCDLKESVNFDNFEDKKIDKFELLSLLEMLNLNKNDTQCSKCLNKGNGDISLDINQTKIQKSIFKQSTSRLSTKRLDLTKRTFATDRDRENDPNR